MKKKLVTGSLMAVWLLAMFLCPLGYTSAVIANASRDGIYPSAEEGMIARLDKSYSADRQIKIITAGPNAHDGSDPFIWYVIAEVHASTRADGSPMGKNGCDAPGSFFLQTKQGWVHVSEGAFPELIGGWMKFFGMAGEGETTPSTDWAPDQPTRFCLE